MDDLSSGLQLYSTIKYGFLLIILCCICVGFSYLYMYLEKKNYLQASNAQVTFKHYSNNTPLDDCSINAPEPDCTYLSEYEAKDKKYVIPQIVVNTKNKPLVGNTTIYYEENAPQNHIISFIKPSNIALIILGIVVILLIASIVNLFLIRSSKSYGAVIGGIEASRDVLSIFKTRS